VDALTRGPSSDKLIASTAEFFDQYAGHISMAVWARPWRARTQKA
jgi:hypothetical protein